MKKHHRLALYGWPLLVVIVAVALPVLIVLRPLRRNMAPIHPVNISCVKYRPLNSQINFEPEDYGEIRALYASDLFASSRSRRFPSPNTATNWAFQTNTPISDAVLPLSLPAESTGIGNKKFPVNNRLPAEDADSLLLIQLRQKAVTPQKKYPALSVELKGGLRQFCIASNIFETFPLPEDKKPWTFQAEMRFNNQGSVEQIFIESADCNPSLCQEIAKRLYQHRLNNVTQACEGVVIISYPAYTTNPPPATSGSQSQN